MIERHIQQFIENYFWLCRHCWEMKRFLCVFSFYGLEGKIENCYEWVSVSADLVTSLSLEGKAVTALRAEFIGDRCEGNASLLSIFSVLFEVHWYLKLYNSLFQILKSFIFCKLLLFFLFFSQNLMANKIMVPVYHMLVSMLAKIYLLNWKIPNKYAAAFM